MAALSATIVSMALAWAERRQTLYYIVGIILLVILAALAWRLFLVHTPSCYDREQNGNEKGVDCGGVCALICPNQAKTPTVLWARSFLTAPHTYTAAAYIQNNNVAEGAGTKQAHYTFQILDSKNLLIVEREGIVDIAPQQTTPVVESGIDVGTRIPAKTFFEFDDNIPMIWNKVPEASLQSLRISKTSPYENNRIEATVANDSLSDAKKVTVVAVLFDTQGIARAAAKAAIPKIARKSSESVTFTWPSDLEDIARAEVTILPSF
jgi:hypothetical protein